VDEVIGLDDLRERLGLAMQEKKRRGRCSAVPLEEQIRRRWAKNGPAATMRWLVQWYFSVTKNDVAVTAARLAIERAGIDFKGGLVAVGNQVIAELLKNEAGSER